MLEHELYIPPGSHDGVPVIILLHGRGADRTDLFALRRSFPRSWAVLAPDAPFPGAPWGYGPGRAWYQFLGRNIPEPESLLRSMAALDELLAELPALIGRAPGPVALGGFSQGGTVSLAHALSRPGAVRHIINFSGFLADHPDVHATPETVGTTRFFWGHGTGDPAIPFPLAIEGRTKLREAGADLTAHDYPIGHWIDPQELETMLAWLAEGFAAES